jgi:hypothetical protein
MPPGELRVPPWLVTASDVWLRPRSKSRGAIGVLVNRRTHARSTHWPLPPAVEGHGWFAIELKGGRQPAPAGLAGAGHVGGYYHVFAHEPAHAMSLADEYEQPDPAYWLPPESFGALNAANLHNRDILSEIREF